MGELRRRVAAMEKPLHWKPSYTHPDKLHPGFTFDFEPSESSASSYSSAASEGVGDDAADEARGVRD